MIFVHQDGEFVDLIRIVAHDARLNTALVEKDYWVTHTLWALHETGLEVWFKGGTSLSKGFNLIQRFSEDLNLQIEARPGSELPHVRSWASANKGLVAQRRAFFTALEHSMVVPDASLHLDPHSLGEDVQTASYQVRYPSKFVTELHESMRPFVLLELGQARVKPHVERALGSFVHDWLERKARLGDYRDNRPGRVRCVHPLVTLLEKIDAIARRYSRGDDPAPFIRHYEDAARIIQNEGRLPKLEGGLGELIESMLKEKRIRVLPKAQDPAFTLADPVRRAKLEKAHTAIGPMFWAERLSLAEACAIVRDWLSKVPLFGA